ncbi:MAG: choice-of-anchor D domain-containing protein, partial [Myxococcota bacterium]
GTGGGMGGGTGGGMGGGTGGGMGGGIGGGMGGGTGGGMGGGTGGGGSACGPGTCNGCCAGGMCLSTSQQTAAQCGSSGAMCVACPSGQVCSNGACVNASTCDATSCASGCCVGPLCLPYAQQNQAVCGTAGVTCQACASGTTCSMGQCTSTGTCNASTCPMGCCSGNLCVPWASQSAASCGTSGAACTMCASGNSCVNGVCTTGSACDFFSCTGCCSGGTCVATSAQSAATCGLNGAACAACTSGATCTGGVCTGGTACNATTCASGCCNGNTCVTTPSDGSCGHSGAACVACGAGRVCSGGTCITTANPACIVISPSDSDFGTVQTGCRSAIKPFTVRNVCPSAVTLNAVGVAGSASFSVAGLPTLPATLAANSTQSFTITFAPTAVGAVSATLVVGVTQSAMSAVYQTPLVGTGATTGANVETFTIPRKTDVLLIVDDSCSMSTAQMALGANANAFLAYAFGAGVDFNLAVTTTDFTTTGPRGAFVGTAPLILKSSTPNLLAVFNQRVNVGINGSGIETMFQPAVAALTPPLITGANGGFLRGDANLSVLAFTDAVEQSPQMVDWYLEQLLAIKGARQRNRFSFSFVGPTQTTGMGACTYDGTNTPDPRETGMVSRTGGVMSEICNLFNVALWRPEAQRVGQAVFGARATWFLTATPSPAAAAGLTVSIGGVPVPETGGNGRNWSYDAARNAVVFEAASLPAPGQSVSFAYSVACTP